MEIKDLLPIGSVVLLKNGEKKLMVCGVKQTDIEGNGKEYDYFGVLYPEGYLGAKFQYLFNHEDIERVFFRGYEDAEREAFIQRLTDLYNTRDN